MSRRSWLSASDFPRHHLRRASCRGFIVFWTFVSPKGGVGVSVVAAAMASGLSKDRAVTIIDFCGDQLDIFGRDARAATGVWDWLYAADDVGVEALSNLEVELRPGFTILPSGSRSKAHPVSPQRCRALADGLQDGRIVIGDLGVLDPDPFSPESLLAASSDRTTLVLRACYLALRRARHLPVVADDVVEVVEGGRALSTLDIEAVVGKAVTARVAIDPRIARAIDAGFLPGRLPRELRRLVRDLKPSPPFLADPQATEVLR